VADSPLAGLRIVVTRPASQAGALVRALEALGAHVQAVPLVEIEQLDDPAALDAVGKRLDDYDWVVFTSANGVQAFGERLGAGAGVPRVAVVGPATADAVRALGVEPSVVGHGAGVDLVPELGELEGARVLLLQAEIAGPEVATALRGRGAAVDAVAAYRTLAREPGPEELKTLRAADAVVLASGSAARSLATSGGAGDAVLVGIGPRTAEVAREVGLSVGLVAGEATVEGIIRALVEHYGEST
jgi:uroporphyrinogen III methyltransferase/synthase